MPYLDDSGELRLRESYKLLVRWAQSICPFTYSQERTSDGEEGRPLAYMTYLIRNDALPLLVALIQGGQKPDEAYRFVAVPGRGEVAAHELIDSEGHTRETGLTSWNWDDIAKMRSMRTAISMAYGAPSLQEIAAMGSQMAQGAEVSDYVEARKELGEHVQVEVVDDRARLSARTRTRLQRFRSLSPAEQLEELRQHNLVLHGDKEDQEGI